MHALVGYTLEHSEAKTVSVSAEKWLRNQDSGILFAAPAYGRFITMGIERNDRKPKRRRTTAQRLKGRMQPVFILPEAPPKEKPAKNAAEPKAEKAATPKAKPAAKKPAAKKPAAKKKED
jgi:hypothetical protein